MGTQFLKPHQIEESLAEKQRLEGLIKMEDPRDEIDKPAAQAQLRRVTKFLEDGTPPTTSPEMRDALHKEVKRLETEIADNMPTRIHMNRKTPGTLDQHMRWEKENKPKILRWKDILRQLDPTNGDPDFTNVERLRRPGDLLEPVPFRVYSGVDIRDGEIVPEGIPDAEKIAQRTAQPETATAVMEEPNPTPEAPTEFTETCECGDSFTKSSAGRAANAVRMHRLRSPKHKGVK